MSPLKINKQTAYLLIVTALTFAAGIFYTSIRTDRLENEIIVSDIISTDIAIINPDTGETGLMKISPASVKAQPAKTGPVSDTALLLAKKSKTHADIPKIGIEEAKRLYASEQAVFLDTRGPKEYSAGHIKGAISLPFNDMPELLPKYRRIFQGKLLVTYCGGSGCMLSEKTAYNLFDNGYEKIAIFFGGWDSWNEAGMPTASDSR